MPKKIPPPLPSGNPEKRNNGVQINDSKITYWFIPPEIGALQISLLQKNILGVVATFTRNGGECWATDVQFGEAFQWSRQKINAAINGMVAAGWLRKDVTRLSNGTTPRRLWLASPPIPLSPTVTSSITDPSDLVTHGDYPCHLGGLPLSPTVTTLVTHGDTNSNIIKKEKVIKEIVADAPTPTCEYPLTLEEPQDSDPLRESGSLEKPIEISEAPPLPAAPPKAKKAALTWDDIRAQVSSEEWQAIETWRGYRLNTHKKKKAASIKSVQAAIEAYGANLIAAIHHSIGNRWEGIHYSSYSKPLGASGLTYQQQQTCFRDFWNEAHGLDRPDLSWVTKQQGAFLQKLMGRLCGSETAYVEVLAKKRPDQFDYQCRDFTNAIKELEQELAK